MNIDLRTAKFLSIIAVICLFFIMLVWNAFSYLPQEEDVYYNPTSYSEDLSQEVVNKKQQTKIVNKEEVPEEEFLDNTIEEVTENENKKEKFKVVAEEQILGSNLQPISEPKDSKEELLNEIDNLTSQKKYVEAITILENALTLVENDDVKAEILDKITLLYAKSKRYGSALSYAQKVYNLHPTTEREVVLARLYYKVGDTNRAQVRMLNVLKREF